ncbi:collectin-12 [Folsomia candida]|uniref:collectin-12 n=1 Tax=Folsomia candida TaxID=158441 RepID=UPI000B905095|nr:collectin-12 [Folsomia candida]
MSPLLGLILLVGLTVASPAAKDVQRFEYLGSLQVPSTQPGRQFEEHRYYASAFSGIWQAAIQDCQDTFGPNGHLVSIESEAEASGLNEWIERRGSGGSSFWTSGQYVITSTTWMWASVFGSPLSYTAWMEGEPTQFPNGRHRISLVHVNQFSAGWKATLDSETMRYVCEFHVQP